MPAAAVLAMRDPGHPWIARVVCVGFMLSALASTTARPVAHRRGFARW